jgi:hypothetical protein
MLGFGRGFDEPPRPLFRRMEGGTPNGADMAKRISKVIDYKVNIVYIFIEMDR